MQALLVTLSLLVQNVPKVLGWPRDFGKYNKQRSGQASLGSCPLQVKDPVSFIKSWLTSHINNAKSLGKPFIVEEFGKALDKHDAGSIAKVRDPVFKAVYDALSDSVQSDGTFKGMRSSMSTSETSKCKQCQDGPYPPDVMLLQTDMCNTMLSSPSM